MIFKVIHPRKEAHSFRQLVKYVLQGHKVEWAQASENIASSVSNPKALALEMLAVASRNHRIKHPQLHIVLSWSEGDVLTKQSMLDAVRTMADRLGLADHQWIAASHSDAMHPHVHFVACRVNPITLRAARLSYSQWELQQVRKDLELRHGWQSSSPYIDPRSTREINGVTWKYKDLLPAALNQRARQSSMFIGRRSFQEWLGSEPRDAAFAVLSSKDPTWAKMHEALALFNLKYAPYGKGASIQDAADPTLRARAVHLARFAALRKLEPMLGPFQPAPSKLEFGAGYRHHVPALRDQWGPPELVREYLEYRKQFSTTRVSRWRAQLAHERERRAQIRAVEQKRKLALRSNPMPALPASTQRALVVADTRRQLAKFDSAITRERIKLHKELAARPLSERAWVISLAKGGNELALEYLQAVRAQQRVALEIPKPVDLLALKVAQLMPLALPKPPLLNLPDIPW